MINAKIDDKKCSILLKGIEDKSKDLSKAMKTIAVDLRTSIEENFEVGGRYSSPVLPSLIKSPYKIYFLNKPYFMRVRKRFDVEKIRKIG